MATVDSMALLELLQKCGMDGDVDFLREATRTLVQALMDAEVSAQIGAERHERSPDRQTQRNGYRQRDWDTRVGTLSLNIPKVRKGTYFPSLLAHRKRSEQALLSVVQEAYVHGVSTRKVDDLVKAMGIDGISKSEVSRMCQDLDVGVKSFRERRFETHYPYVWLDATFPKVREGGRVMSMALVIAIGVKETGEREVLGFDLGLSEEGAFWTSFLRSLVQRGLRGVKLCISDAHEGLKQAISSVLVGSSWQRCRVHVMRNILSQVPRKSQGMASAVIKTIFAQENRQAAQAAAVKAVLGLRDRFPKAADVLEHSIDDVLTFMDFPTEHWTQISNTNVLERLNREIRRRTNVVGIFPNREATLRLVGPLLQEIDEDWMVGNRAMSKSSMMKLRPPGEVNELTAESLLLK